MKSDQELLRSISSGDEGALSDLYDRHVRLIYSLVYRITREARQAEELTQDVFWQAWRQASNYDASRGTPLAWLTTVARSRALDFLRSSEARRIRLLQTAVELESLSTDNAGKEEELLLEERGRKVREALRELPAAQRQALELAYFGGLSQSDIAAHLREPLGTVKTRIRQGMLKMKQSLTLYMGTDRL